MDQPLFLLFGAGALIVISAFFLKENRSREAKKARNLQNSIDRTEMEKTLKRFVVQIQQENEQTAVQFQRQKQELMQELRRLNERMQQLETEASHLRAKVADLETRSQAASTIEGEAEEMDSLLLKERFKRVFELKQEGLDANEIAKRLGAGRGEIDLIFSLAEPTQRGASDD